MILELLSIALAAIVAVGQPLLLVLCVILALQFIRLNAMKLKAMSKLDSLADAFEKEAKEMKKELKRSRKVGE